MRNSPGNLFKAIHIREKDQHKNNLKRLGHKILTSTYRDFEKGFGLKCQEKKLEVPCSVMILMVSLHGKSMMLQCCTNLHPKT